MSTGFIEKVPEPEPEQKTEEKTGLTAEEFEALMAKAKEMEAAFHYHTERPKVILKPKNADKKAKARKKIADASRKRNRR